MHAALFVSVIWHGYHAGYFFCIYACPFYVMAEDIYYKLYYKDATGMVSSKLRFQFIHLFSLWTLGYLHFENNSDSLMSIIFSYVLMTILNDVSDIKFKILSSEKENHWLHNVVPALPFGIIPSGCFPAAYVWPHLGVLFICLPLLVWLLAGISHYRPSLRAITQDESTTNGQEWEPTAGFKQLVS